MTTTIKALLSACHVAIFIYGFQLQRNDAELSDINAIGFSIYCSRGAALCLAFDMALIMLPVCRKLLSYASRICFLLLHLGQGTISEGSHSNLTRYHKYLAYHILAFLAIHILGHCVNFYRLEQLGRGKAFGYHFGTWAGITGYWMLLLLGIMFMTAHRKIRERNYEVFWYTHHLAILVMGFYAFHGYGCFVKTNDGQCRGYGSWRYVVLASLIYLAERALRAFESYRTLVLSSAIAHPGGAIELNFKQPSIHYRPGQHLYLNIPKLSKYEWHPFTITSSPIEQYISLDIRPDGDWTEGLGRLLGHGPETPKLEQAQAIQDRSLLPLIRVDGPYGGPKDDVLSFDHAVLIGTGNGITTFSGILRHIWFRHQETQSSRLKTLDLYWVSRDANKLDWFQSLFSMEKTMELFRTGLVRVHIYFTASRLSRLPTIRRSSSIRVAKDGPDQYEASLIDAIRPAQGRYSEEDDDDHDEEAELLSPLDRPAGSSSLISLRSIQSPPLQHHPAFDRAAHARTEAPARPTEDQGDAIINPSDIHYGRPDFMSAFEVMKGRCLMNDSAVLPVKVGVFYCGSPSLGKSLARDSMHSAQKINNILCQQGSRFGKHILPASTSRISTAARTSIGLSRLYQSSYQYSTDYPKPEPHTPLSTSSSNPTPPKKNVDSKGSSHGSNSKSDSMITPKDRAFYPYHMDIQLRWSDTHRGAPAHLSNAQKSSSLAHPPLNDLFETIVQTFLVQEAGLGELSSKVRTIFKEGQHRTKAGHDPNSKEIGVLTTESCVDEASSCHDLSLRFPGTVEARLAVLEIGSDKPSVTYQIGIFKKLTVSDPSLTLQSSPSSSGAFSRDASTVAAKGEREAGARLEEAGAAGLDREAQGIDPRFHPSQVQGDAVVVGQLRQDFVDRWNGVPLAVPEHARKALERLRVVSRG
ncbi:hypothetical protein BGZ75_008120 [Mortierella antarctica]|nr:hypothetical protein BGZ75_008120 [Mortierella antarctica]